MADKTTIGNIALGKIGITAQMTNADTDRSLQAAHIRLHYDLDREYVLTLHPWAFATAYAELGLVEGTSAEPVNYDWTFAYRIPSDCLHPRRILTPNGRREQTPPPFRQGRDGVGGLIYTNWEDPTLEYTVRITNDAELDAQFALVLACRLAVSIAPGLTRMPDMVKSARAEFEFERARLGATKGNAEGLEPLPDAPWHLSRDEHG